MRHVIPLLLAALFLTACAGRSAEQYIRDWPTLSDREKHAIRNDCVFIGMNAVHVTGAIGPPMRTRTLSTKSGTREQFVYPGAYATAYVYVKNGKVSGIHDSRVYRLRC